MTTSGLATKRDSLGPARVALIASLALVGVASAECNSASPASTLPSGETQRSIGPAGGTLSASDGSYIRIPPGALTTQTTITMTAVAPSLLPGAQVPGGAGYQFGPDGLIFQQPVTIALAFSPEALPAGTTVSDLAVFTATTGGALWLNTIIVDATHIAAQTMHFSPPNWPAATNTRGLQIRTPPPLCVVAGGATLVTFPNVETGTTGSVGTNCQCLDGTSCPNGDDINSCKKCNDGSLAPFNKRSSCPTCLPTDGGEDDSGQGVTNDASSDSGGGDADSGPTSPPDAGALDAGSDAGGYPLDTTLVSRHPRRASPPSLANVGLPLKSVIRTGAMIRVRRLSTVARRDLTVAHAYC